MNLAYLAEATKICSKCGIEKPESEFQFWSKPKNIRRSLCKPCTKQQAQENKTRDPSIPRRANKGKAIRDLTKGRICLECKQYKDRENFWEHPHGVNGLSGVCKNCKIPNTESKKALYDARKSAQICVKCANPELVNGTMCLECWFLDKASARAGGTNATELIKKLWEEQNSLCYYSDEPLIPGENASLDHHIPRCKGGQDDVSNLKWVAHRINLMKSDMTHEEFIKMCHYISNKFPL